VSLLPHSQSKNPLLTPPSVEISSPHAGKVANLNSSAGQVVKVGQTLCVLETDAVSGDEAPAEEPAPAAEAPAPARVEAPTPTPAPTPPAPTPTPAASAPAPASSERKVPRAPRPHPLSDTAVRFQGEASVLPNAPPPPQFIPDSVEARRPGGGDVKSIIKTSPAVRALAGRLGVELEECTPTGPGGRVTKDDVERAAAKPPAQSAPATAPLGSSAPAAAAPRAVAPPPVTYSADRGEEVERMEMGRTRKVMYKAMGSMGDVPHFG
jgi:pyruvate/2-oxoglutarate dehydrogenase complex dihydrolipoamide acyltransferase (E2) component